MSLFIHLSGMAWHEEDTVSSACKQHPEMRICLLRVMPLAPLMQMVAAHQLNSHTLEVPWVAVTHATLKAEISSITFLLKCQIL